MLIRTLLLIRSIGVFLDLSVIPCLQYWWAVTQQFILATSGPQQVPANVRQINEVSALLIMWQSKPENLFFQLERNLAHRIVIWCIILSEQHHSIMHNYAFFINHPVFILKADAIQFYSSQYCWREQNICQKLSQPGNVWRRTFFRSTSFPSLKSKNKDNFINC